MFKVYNIIDLIHWYDYPIALFLKAHGNLTFKRETVILFFFNPFLLLAITS